MTKDIKLSDLLTKDQLQEIKQRREWRNILSLISIWSQMILCMLLFYFFPSRITLFLGVVVIGSRQFALAVLMHEGAHKLLFSNPNKVEVSFAIVIFVVSILVDLEK